MSESKHGNGPDVALWLFGALVALQLVGAVIAGVILFSQVDANRENIDENARQLAFEAEVRRESCQNDRALARHLEAAAKVDIKLRRDFAETATPEQAVLLREAVTSDQALLIALDRTPCREP
jgi:hypothetical protein